MCRTIKVAAMMLAQLVSVALTASVKATDTKSVSSFNHFLSESQYNALQHTILCDSWIEVPANTDWIWTAGAKTAQYKLHF